MYITNNLIIPKTPRPPPRARRSAGPARWPAPAAGTASVRAVGRSCPDSAAAARPGQAAAAALASIASSAAG
ncbi:hypothetical protein G6F58_013264 [Rhizopus delemar]|nr:hypothetical protein G6F58_013264 [Rhizopus delemar]